MCSRPFETRSLPSSLAATHRGFAFYVAFPKRSIPSLATFSMSLASPRLRSRAEHLKFAQAGPYLADKGALSREILRDEGLRASA
jgi:hypothetical protein